ncbi:glycosyltransferase involved in cell wall biosynthesis [Buttiauxella sp. BIGb0552]|uniref:glycosyltransferase n=1 Tax=Buttiauxella sp. BIGb0552 TaxID=2485120 RepID=UPI001066DCB6|nr:glycosyltransferase [Buttiauxella sp. BIGb0552]TDX16947.1 glycosyltransferase involved in cell wall biosynthesis [Buttiauxella sp. BIGb0552]
MSQKILFVITNLNMGGAEKVTVNIIKSLAQLDYKISIFLLKNEGVLISDLPKNVEIYYGGEGALKLNFWNIIIKLIKIIKQHDVVIGALELLPTYLSFICSRICGKKIIGWVHTDLQLYLENKKWYEKYLAKLFYTKIKNIIFVSEGSKKSLQNICSDRVYNNWDVIPNAIDSEYYLNVVERKDKPRYNLIWYGRYEKVKRIDFLLDVVKILVEKEPRYRLLLIGYGSCEEQIKMKISSLDLSENITMLSRQTTLVPFLDSSDIFVLTSEYEGFGNVIVEAMARGLPIVSSDCPHGPKEILDNGKYGVLIEKDDMNAFASAIMNICSVNHIYFDLSKKSITRAEKYHPNNICLHWVEYLIKVNEL